MVDVNKSRIFLRRGTDAGRLQTTLCQGELGFSTDNERVYVGDGSTVGGIVVGTNVWFVSSVSGMTSLTAASADGRAEIGDFAWIPASSFNVNTINTDAPSTTITPPEDIGIFYTLSARDGSGDLTWVAVNSGIPISQLNIPDNSINGSKIHGGDISGNVNFSGSLSSTTVTATSGKFHSLSGTGSRVVYAESDGTLNTDTSNDVINTKEFFNPVNITTTLTAADNTSDAAVRPLTAGGDSDWQVFDISAEIASRTTLPVTYPKAAIINVYTTALKATGKRCGYALFSSAEASTYENQYNLNARWHVGEDSGGGADIWSYGNTFYIPMNGSNNNLVLQHTLLYSNGGRTNDDLTVDLVGVEY